MKSGKLKRSLILCAVILPVIAVLFFLITWYGYLPFPSFRGESLGIPDLISEYDRDGDGIDDYADFVKGARAFVSKKPEYKSEYYEGGYPPEGIGVCTDVIWSAFEEAGYDLKAMVDADIASDPTAYGIEYPDSNIDFRRVVNLDVFFARNAESLPTSLKHPSDFMPGDILIYEHHVVLLSDQRNLYGFPLIIHHGGMCDYETNGIARNKILAHYRFTGIGESN